MGMKATVATRCGARCRLIIPSLREPSRRWRPLAPGRPEPLVTSDPSFSFAKLRLGQTKSQASCSCFGSRFPLLVLVFRWGVRSALSLRLTISKSGKSMFAIGLAPASIEAGIGPAISAADPAARSHRRLAGRARRRASASPTTGRARQALSRVRRSRRLCLFRSNKPSPLLAGGQWMHRVSGVITCGAGSRRRRGSRRSGNSRRG